MIILAFSPSSTVCREITIIGHEASFISVQRGSRAPKHDEHVGGSCINMIVCKMKRNLLNNYTDLHNCITQCRKASITHHHHSQLYL